MEFFISLFYYYFFSSFDHNKIREIVWNCHHENKISLGNLWELPRLHFFSIFRPQLTLENRKKLIKKSESIFMELDYLHRDYGWLYMTICGVKCFYIEFPCCRGDNDPYEINCFAFFINFFLLWQFNFPCHRCRRLNQ